MSPRLILAYLALHSALMFVFLAGLSELDCGLFVLAAVTGIPFIWGILVSSILHSGE